MLAFGVGEQRWVLFLGGDFAWHAMPAETNTSARGTIIEGVRLEVDPLSILKDAAEEAGLIRKSAGNSQICAMVRDSRFGFDEPRWLNLSDDPAGKVAQLSYDESCLLSRWRLVTDGPESECHVWFVHDGSSRPA